MKLKIYFIATYLLINVPILSMELSEKAREELIQNQKDIVEICKGINSEQNKFLALCLSLSKKCSGCILKELNQEAVKVKIEALEDYLEKDPTYQIKLEDAQAVENDPHDFDETAANNQWREWRYTATQLMWGKLAQKKIINQIPTIGSIPDFVKAHANITEEEGQYLLANFAVTIRLRETQRTLTKRYLEPLRAK